MLDTAICDDDISFAGGLEEMIYGMEQAYGIKFDIDAFRDGSSLVKEVKGGRRYDVICLDIRMQGMDGREAARQIRRMDRTVELVYVTSYDSYMKEVFEVTPSGFIVKPLDYEEFKKTFSRVLRVILGQDAYYRFRHNKEDYKILIRDILYFMSDLRKAHIIGECGSYMEYRKLGNISRIPSQNVSTPRSIYDRNGQDITDDELLTGICLLAMEPMDTKAIRVMKAPLVPGVPDPMKLDRLGDGGGIFAQESADVYNRVREFTRQFQCCFIVAGSCLGWVLEPELRFSSGDVTSVSIYILPFEEKTTMNS